ncbi:MAG: GTP-sensing pleiotropic transcriptional regulator CodY, partial [Desemzia incerta]
MEELLEKMRKMNRILQTVGGIVDSESADDQLPFTNLTKNLGNILEANTYLIDEKGKLLGFFEKHAINNDRVKQMLIEKQFPANYANSMLEITRTTSNIGIESD